VPPTLLAPRRRGDRIAADLGAQLNLLDRGKLTKEAQSGINLALERLAYDDLRKGRRSSRGGGIALRIRIG
jgi:hypothetical protein